jgi:hypothetical protein
MTKTAFAPPHRGGSYRVGKDGKAERVERTVQLSDPAHPVHAARAGQQAATAARRDSGAPPGASREAATARGHDESKED